MTENLGKSLIISVEPNKMCEYCGKNQGLGQDDKMRFDKPRKGKKSRSGLKLPKECEDCVVPVPCGFVCCAGSVLAWESKTGLKYTPTE